MRTRTLLFSLILSSLITLSCTENGSSYELSTAISEKAFYSSNEDLIHLFGTSSQHCQKNFIAARAFREKKELKNALLYYANSCFDDKYNFNIRLFPHPVYSFVDSSSGRSIFYRDSIFWIASIFFEYGEHQYVIKFTELLENDGSALYRESVLLKAKSLQKLNRNKEAASELLDILSDYSDGGSRSLIYLRLGSVYESLDDYRNAINSYTNAIKSDSGIWQNTVAAKRLMYLSAEKKAAPDNAEQLAHYASALYDSGEHDLALAASESAIKKGEYEKAELIKIKILTLKSRTKAASFLREKENSPLYDRLLLEHANIIWDKGNKYEAARIYDRLTGTRDSDILKRILVRLSYFYEERNRPELVKYMELYIKSFPEKDESGRFNWLIGRYYLRNGSKTKAKEYFARGIRNYPGSSYTAYCRFWLKKITSGNSLDDDYLQEYVIHNPNTYHTLSLLKMKAESMDYSIIEKEFQKAVSDDNSSRMQLYNSLLFMKNGYNKNLSERLKKFDSGITGKYTELNELIKKPEFSGSYKKLLSRLEVYFYSGDTASLNKEINIIPEDSTNDQKDLALALTLYSLKHHCYGYASYYAGKLLDRMDLKENLPYLDPAFARALYPFAFSECVTEESRRSGISPSLILAMMKAESNFNHNAVSPAGAAGLMQLMPPTAKGIARDLGVKKYDITDPCTSIKFGANYIAWLNRYYKGEIEYMVAGYNAGAGNVNKWKERDLNRDIDYFSEFTPFDETRDYIFSTKKFRIQYETIYRGKSSQ